MAQAIAVRALLAAVLCLAPSLLMAQTTPSGVIRGTVVDTAGRPIENADVSVEQLRQRVRTSAEGRFAFVGVKPGRYTVGVRSIGDESASSKITVKDSAVTVQFALTRRPFSLPARVTTASRGGLSGVIADTGYAPLADVRVQIVAVEEQATTDSRGAFFLPVKPGKYLVRLRRDGYASQLIGVTVPVNEGREIAAWMVPQQGKSNPRFEANLFDMRKRKIMAKPATAHFYSREEIDKFGYVDLLPFVRGGAGFPVSQDCWVTINGGPRRDFLWNVSTDDIEYIELYEPGRPRVTAGPPSASREKMAEQRLERATAPTPGSYCPTMWVWTRQ
jgi:uncharacterized membrane protein